MVSPVIRDVLRSLSSQELEEVRLFIDQLDSSEEWGLTENQQHLIHQRDEINADPSLAVSAKEMLSDIRASRSK